MIKETLKKITQREFKRNAKIYDQKYTYFREVEYPRICETVRDLKFSRVLDCGCGTGELLSILRKEFPDAILYGIDITKEMLDVAKEKKISDVSLIYGDCEKLEFDPDSFDLIICCHSFHHFTNPQEFFKSANRVLGKDGHILLEDNSAGFLQRFYLNFIGYRICNFLGHNGDVKCYSKKEIVDLGKKEGFSLERYSDYKDGRAQYLLKKAQ